ncbi:MAG TPA: baseplate J/gp47 family protein [Candidatus Nanopelagicales bacterium]|nr:baseplate J/gp47 family protein [Candidatus Nanopelagicales bacterium]
MASYGVTDDGFVIKGLDVLLAEAFDRARAAFGADVDLTPTSPLRKIIEVAAAEDAEIWKRMEDGYYAGFVSTADGPSLDLLGDDLGLSRRETLASGTVTLTLGNGVPGRTYVVGEATPVISASIPGLTFATDAPVTLTAAAPTADAAVTCLRRGLVGNVAAGDLAAIEPAVMAVEFADLGPATLTVTNQRPCSGGGEPEDTDVYRGRLLGTARTLWTAESVHQAVLDVDGVVDATLSDPLGGVDVSQSVFGLFDFGNRLYSAERGIGEAYTVDVVVAHEFRWPWRTAGAVPGVFERVSAAIDRVRPPGVHPNVIEADQIEIGVRAGVVIQPGYDGAALLARIMARIAGEASGFRLGSDVLASQVMRAFTDEPGVIDVRGLHLRRGQPAFGRITLGGEVFMGTPVEAAVGENLAMGPTELAQFQPDSILNDVAVVAP